MDVPFRIPGSRRGGVLKADPIRETVTVEWPGSRNQPESMEIPNQAILKVTWDRGVFSATLSFEFRDQDLITELARKPAPLSGFLKEDQLAFEIRRADRTAAETFVRDLRYSLMSDTLGDMLDSIDDEVLEPKDN